MESKTDVPGITITYFQPKTNITVNRENIYMGAKRTNDIPNYGAQAEFIIKDLVWLVLDIFWLSGVRLPMTVDSI